MQTVFLQYNYLRYEDKLLNALFYVDKKGHLVTCLHIVNSCIEERLFAYQIGKKKELELTIIKKSDKYDLALCKSAPSGIETTWPFINKPYVDIGSDVEAYGYEIGRAHV